MIAREQLRLLLNSAIPMDDEDLVHFCKKVIFEYEDRQKSIIEFAKQHKKKKNTSQSILDAAYTPLAISDDYFYFKCDQEPGYNASELETVHLGGIETKMEDYVFPLTREGRGTKVEKLPEGPVGEIADLIYFSRKRTSMLRVPDSYLNLGKDPGGFTLDDLGDEE